MQIGFDRIKIGTTGGLTLPEGLSLPDAVKQLDDSLKERVGDILKERGMRGLPWANEQIPDAFLGEVNKKVAYIEKLIGASALFAATSGVLKKTSNYVMSLDRETPSFITRSKLSSSGNEDFGIVGTFMQDIFMFGGATAQGVPMASLSSGAISSMPDIKEIETELKAYPSPRVHVGYITAIIESTNSSEEQIALDTLRSNAVKAYVAAWELGNKMKNLLLIKYSIAYTRKKFGYGTRKGVFQAIILFVEIIMEKIFEWINEGLGEVDSATAPGGIARPYEKKYDKSLGGWQPLKDAVVNITLESSNMSGKRRDDPESGFTVTPTANGVRYQQSYSIEMQPNLASILGKIAQGKGSIKELWETSIKNLSDLYVARYDILDSISGVGKFKEASTFFREIKSRNIKMFRFNNTSLV